MTDEFLYKATLLVVNRMRMHSPDTGHIYTSEDVEVLSSYGHNTDRYALLGASPTLPTKLGQYRWEVRTLRDGSYAIGEYCLAAKSVVPDDGWSHYEHYLRHDKDPAQLTLEDVEHE